MVQTTCRLKNWPLDKSTLYTVVTKHTDTALVSQSMARVMKTVVVVDGGVAQEYVVAGLCP